MGAASSATKGTVSQFFYSFFLSLVNQYLERKKKTGVRKILTWGWDEGRQANTIFCEETVPFSSLKNTKQDYPEYRAHNILWRDYLFQLIKKHKALNAEPTIFVKLDCPFKLIKKHKAGLPWIQSSEFLWIDCPFKLIKNTKQTCLEF